MRKPTVITVTLSLFLLAAGLADTPNAWAFTEKKVSKTLSPMPKPAYTVGYKWHYIKDDKEEGVWVVTATGNGTISWTSSHCNWIKADRGFAPSRKWDCKDDSSGTQRARFKGGNIWPLRVGNKFSYSVKGRYTRGGKSWSGVRQCKVKEQVRIETVSGEYDTYKVVCEDKGKTHTWWLSPELKAVVRYKRLASQTHTWEMTKIEWPRVAAKRQLVISPLTEAEGGTSQADTIYREGYRFSVQQDYAKAVIWYRTAAEEGHAGAQYNLGAAYANGAGVSADQETAVDWFFKAGQAFLKDGSRAKARQALAAIERVVPGHLLAKRLLEQVYGQPGTPATVTRQPEAVSTPTPSPTTVAKAAPTIEKRTTTPFKVAIFPFGSDTECIGRSRPSHKKLASEVETLIKANDSLTLAYSYYNKDRNYSPIKKPERLWARRGAKPEAAKVFSLGEARGVDAVVTYWRARAGPNTYCEERMPPFRIDVHVFDIKQKKKYQQKGREKHLNAITKQALSRFLQVVPDPNAEVFDLRRSLLH